jgi:hypothetical protein
MGVMDEEDASQLALVSLVILPVRAPSLTKGAASLAGVKVFRQWLLAEIVCHKRATQIV